MSNIVIRQRTTPTHTFTLPFETSLVSALEISYKQNGETKILKTEADIGDSVTMDGNNLIVNLTSTETDSLSANGNVGIQVWLRDTSGKALLSDIYTASVYIAQNKETS